MCLDDIEGVSWHFHFLECRILISQSMIETSLLENDFTNFETTLTRTDVIPCFALGAQITLNHPPYY